MIAVLVRSVSSLLHPRSVRAALIVYLAVAGILYTTIAAVIAVRQAGLDKPAQGASSAIAKTAFYAQHANDFDLVFLGDSRTYCGIHPELIDRQIGTRSINLAVFAHWLPTQYPQLVDVTRAAPSGTTIVWSIGHQSFFPSTGIWSTYAIDPVMAVRYLAWGVPTRGLWDNVYAFIPGLQPLALRHLWRTRLTRELERPVPGRWAAGGRADAVKAGTGRRFDAEAQALLERYRNDPDVVFAQPESDNGAITSVGVHMKGGGLYLIELDTEHFRGRQQVKPVTEEAARATILPEPQPGYWRLFEESLDVLARSRARVVVNELEEAGYTYGHPIIRDKWRQFMRERVQPLVEAKGFRYVRADFNRYPDEDYFDYNHLNSRGAEKYDVELSALLRPYLNASAR